MRILITNNTLREFAGTELFVLDLARALLARGHTPVAYSTELGKVGERLRWAGVPVIDDLASLAAPPDIIHGHHHLETMTALGRFPLREKLLRVPVLPGCIRWLARCLAWGRRSPEKG